MNNININAKTYELFIKNKNQNKQLILKPNLILKNNEIHLKINSTNYVLKINLNETNYQCFIVKLINFIDNSFNIYAYDFKTKEIMPNRTF